MKGYEIQRRKLVIAVWDDDSGKSHDDFMEGVSQSLLILNFYFTLYKVCVKMDEFACFEKLGKSVAVKLKCQEKNGHVKTVHNFFSLNNVRPFSLPG